MPQVKYHHLSLARGYVRDVLNGKIAACKWVKLACERQKNDLKRSKFEDFPYRFDPAAAERVCKFISMLRHVKGKWAGQPIVLEPWQCFILTTVFGWVKKSNGKRRFSQAYIEVPRKNAKSTKAAGVGLYMLVADGEAGAEVYSGATSEKQAWEVFRPAKMMASQTPGFRSRWGVTVSASSISVGHTGSRFEPIIKNPGDGSSPTCPIHDEFHEHDTPDQADTMKTGMGAREQPLQWFITTAGSNLAGPCYDKRDEVTKILEGVFPFEDIFGIIYTIDKDDDWTSLPAWKKANPNYGISIFEDFIKARLSEAKSISSRTNELKRKHLNIWTNASTAWMNMLEWRACADAPPLYEFLGDEAAIGVDLSTKLDITSRAMIFRRMIDGLPHYYAYVNNYLPEDRVEEAHKNKQAYEKWAAEGKLILTDGNVTDIGRVEQDIRDDSELFQIGDVAYDPFQAQHMANRLSDDGFEVVEFRQTLLNYSEPMKELEALVKAGRFHHNGCPVLEWMVNNVVAYYDKKDNIQPNKDRPENKIDGLVAILMALARFLVHDMKIKKSVYEDRDLREV